MPAQLLRLSFVLCSLWLFALPAARADQDACLKAHEQAQLERMRGRFVEARRELLACAQASCPALVRADCKNWLEEVDRSLPSLVFAVADAQGRDLIDARVSTQSGVLSDRADGRALAINPGVYRVRIEAPGHEPTEQRVSVREGEKRRLVRVVLRARRAGSVAPAAQASAEDAASTGQESAASPGERRAKRLMLSGYVLGGAGLVSLLSGVALGARGKHELDALHEKECRPECAEGEVNAGKRKYILADLAFGAAGALIATAVISWALGYRRQRETRSPTLAHGRTRALRPLSVHVDAHRVSFGWGTRF